MICPRCATNLESGARFCGACGAKLNASGELEHSRPEWTGPGRPAAPGRAPVGSRADNAKTLVSAEPMFPGGAPAPQPQVVHHPAPQPQAHHPAPQPQAHHPAPQPQAAPRPAPMGAPPAASPLAPAPRPGPLSARPMPADPFLGRTLNNRYLVESKLGEGGFGSVYKGRQVAIGREVALKLLRPEMARDQNIVARFRREGAVACNLRDAHTITTYDFDQTPEGIMYIAMELLKGRSLHDVFHDEAPLPWQRVCHILEQMCSSLGEAHQAGIVHRDLKPENVYLENRPGHPDYVKILDFGIAKIVSGEIGGGSQSPQLTATGQTLGTLEYMSPEQLMGKPLDGRSDVYALGVVAYELLTGQLPFPDAKGPAELIAAQLKKTPPAPSTIRPESMIPAGVDAVIATMVEKSRDKRFTDVGQLRDALAHVMNTGGAVPASAVASTAPAVAGGPPPAAAPYRPATPLPMGQSMASVQPLGPPPAAPPLGRRIPSTKEAIAASKGSGNLWLWIILAAFLLGGGVAGVYFAFLR